MKRVAKLVLGVATLWPLIYFLGFTVLLFSIFTAIIEGRDGPEMFAVIAPIHIFTILWVFMLTVVYIVDLFRNDRVSGDKKALWAVVIFLGGLVAMPIYWYLYVWREAPGRRRA